MIDQKLWKNFENYSEVGGGGGGNQCYELCHCLDSGWNKRKGSCLNPCMKHYSSADAEICIMLPTAPACLCMSMCTYLVLSHKVHGRILPSMGGGFLFISPPPPPPRYLWALNLEYLGASLRTKWNAHWVQAASALRYTWYNIWWLIPAESTRVFGTP